MSSFAKFLISYAQHNTDKAATVIAENFDTIRYDYWLAVCSQTSNTCTIYPSQYPISLCCNACETLQCRLVSEAYPPNLKMPRPSLKSIVESFIEPMEGVAGVKSSPSPLKYTMIPPADCKHGLTHEKVMPFLRKLESGQQREGMLYIETDYNCSNTIISWTCVYRYSESIAWFGGNFTSFSWYLEAFCGKIMLWSLKQLTCDPCMVMHIIMLFAAWALQTCSRPHSSSLQSCS